MDPLQEIIERCGDVSALSDDELSTLLEELNTAIGEAAEAARTEADMDAVEAAIGVRDTVATQVTERAEAAEALETRRTAAREAVAPPVEDAPPAEGEEGDGETPPVEGEEPPVAVAASTPPKKSAPARTAARRPAAMKPRQETAPAWNLVASANVPGITAGEPLDTPERVATAFASAFEATRGRVTGPRVKMPVARISARYPDERYLDGNARENQRKLNQVTSLDAITGSGGICAPSEILYDVPTLGTDARPVRDRMMTNFGADRGGVTTLPPPIITDVVGAVDNWTNTDDINASSTKPCLEVTCPSEDETLVEAITRCLQFGNFRARFWAEQIDAWMRLVGVQHARFAENRLLAAIGTGSTQVTAGQNYGTVRDVLANLDRAVSALRSRHRIGEAFPLRWGYPFWLLANIRTDLAREGYGTTDERLARADATIESYFRSRNVNPTSFLDGEAGQILGTQGDGPMINWPTSVITYLYPEGSWLFLDGGTLDLGLVRDSTLNSTNDVQMFAETFEGAHFHGVESWRIVMDICPSGVGQVALDKSAEVCFEGS